MSTTLQKFVEADDQYNIKKARIKLGILFVLGCLGICQTQRVIGWIGRQDIASIRQEMAVAEQAQEQIRESYFRKTGHTPPFKITFHPLFNDKQKQMLEAARVEILRDQKFQDTLEGLFQTCFRHASVVVIPAWHMHNSANYEWMGIPRASGLAASVHAGDPTIEGFTIRDRYPNEAQRTIDGIPRIALNLEAFQSTKTLQLTLFHELLHGLNIPGHEPLGPINQFQNDLTYLPEYRIFVSQTRLDGWREYKINAGVALFWLALAIVAIRAPKGTLLVFRRRRMRKEEIAHSTSDFTSPVPNQDKVEEEQ
jgi:hypothetical protein